MQNQQAMEQGKRANEIIESLNNLSNPQENIVTDKTEVEVLDKATQVVHPSEQPAPAAPVAQDNYEERFKRYKASTDITIRDLRQEVATLKSFESENETLKTQLADALAKIPAAPNEMLEMFSNEEVTAFDKMVDGKVGGLKSEVARLNDELDKERKDKVENVKAVAHKNLVERVRKVVPNYDDINNSDGFRDYMNDIDDFGNVRIEMLARAKQATPPDVGRIIQFFHDFANSNTEHEAPVDKRQTYTQQELLQNPSSSASGVPQGNQSMGIIWDQATVSQLYKDKATGKIDAKQFAELEADMRHSMGWK